MSTIRITGTIPIIDRILKDLESVYIILDRSDYKKNSKSQEFRVYCTIIPKAI